MKMIHDFFNRVAIIALLTCILNSTYAQSAEQKLGGEVRHSFGLTAGWSMGSLFSYKLLYGKYATQVTALPIWTSDSKYVNVSIAQMKVFSLQRDFVKIDFLLYGLLGYTYDESRDTYTAVTTNHILSTVAKTNDISTSFGAGARIPIMPFISFQALFGLRPHFTNGVFQSHASADFSIFCDLW